ncbi:AraC family transcriptional regulator [Pseudomonas sp. NA-150]|uniref:AraC family transcriptional regulator n=1 Tax=Pseudomonas sp. NA-150 TaxID=3367525 RepID=UPI0037C8E786
MATAIATDAAAPQFWRDEQLPFIEARSIQDGRKVCYGPHAHETFSIGAVTGGRSTYLNKHARERIGAGVVVLMNPEDVHACNPVDDQPWSYRMLYVDVPWLTRLQHELGFSQNQDFRAFAPIMSADPVLFSGLNRLYATLTDPDAETLHQHSSVIEFFTLAQQTLNPSPRLTKESNLKLERAADFISEHCTQALSLDDICSAADLSASYLIRAFKQRFGMTPHAYLINRRLQFGRAQLKRGHRIADVALEAGFADQAHFQRAFKRFHAATPGQYQG